LRYARTHNPAIPARNNASPASDNDAGAEGITSPTATTTPPSRATTSHNSTLSDGDADCFRTETRIASFCGVNAAVNRMIRD